MDDRTIKSFLVALLVPWVIATVINLFFDTLLVLVPTGVALSIWSLYGGFQKNGELEEKIGALFAVMTNWVIPPGISWWYPWPFGTALRPTNIEIQTLDRSVRGGKPIIDVKTRGEGGLMVVGITMAWRIIDSRTVANFSPDDHKKQVDSTLDRAVRHLALHYDADEEHSDVVNSGLTSRKRELSDFIMGKTVKGLSPDGTVLIDVPSDTTERFLKLGVEVVQVDVNDVNEPEEVQRARAAQMAEYGEGKKEELDIQSVRRRVLELMWGTSDPAIIKQKQEAGEAPLMSQAEALETVRTARGDITVIKGSDFTGAEALRQKGFKRK